jgi:hypothetical protein
MGWRMAGLMVDDHAVDRVLDALPGAPKPVGDTALGEEALSMSLAADYAITEVAGWTVVSDPTVAAVWTSGVGECWRTVIIACLVSWWTTSPPRTASPGMSAANSSAVPSTSRASRLR